MYCSGRCAGHHMMSTTLRSALHAGVVLAVRIDVVPVRIGDVGRIGGAFVEIGLPRHRHVFRHVAGLQADVEIVVLAQRILDVERVVHLHAGGGVRLRGGDQEVRHRAVRLDAVRRPVDRRIAHDPVDLGARAERAAERVRQHAAIEPAAGLGRRGRIGLERIVGRVLEPAFVDLVDEAAARPLLENEQLIVGQAQELRRHHIGQAVVAAQHRHQRQVMDPAADAVLDLELVLLAGKPQQAEQIAPHRPVRIVAHAAVLVVDRRACGSRPCFGRHLARSRPRQRSLLLRCRGGARQDVFRHLRELVRIEHAALLLVVREVRLAEDVAQEAELVGPIQDRPDVAVEPRLVRPVPGEPAVLPLPQRGLVVDNRRAADRRTCRPCRRARYRRRTRGRTGRGAPRPSSPCRALPARSADSRRSPRRDTRRRRSARW